LIGEAHVAFEEELELPGLESTYLTIEVPQWTSDTDGRHNSLLDQSLRHA
jgi:hypothetical protein